MVADASDILNQFLMQLIRVAHQCQARDDSSARAWRRTTVIRLIEDEAKTPRRRFELLVKRLISLGYHHDSGRTKEHPPNQQPPNQQPPNQQPPTPVQLPNTVFESNFTSPDSPVPAPQFPDRPAPSRISEQAPD